MSGDVVDPAAESLALQHELVHPLGVDAGGGGADQLPVLILLLDLHPGQRRLQWSGVGLLALVGLVVSQNSLNISILVANNNSSRSHSPKVTQSLTLSV